MTLFIGALVLGVLWLFFFLGIWLFEIPQLVALEWVVIVVATAILTLQFQDFFDKLLRKEKRDLMNIQYLGGLSITLIGVSSWLWWASADTTGEFWWRLGVTFLLGGANILYMGSIYRKSVTPEEELEDQRIERFRAREQKKWGRWRKKVEKATEEDAVRYLASHLRFALVGDSYSGDLDFARPLAVVGDETLTYDELVKRDVSDSLSAQVMMYINSLV